MERMEHPLINSLIMQQVFGYFATSASIQDFKNCRLVSRIWSAELLSHWRKNAVITIYEKKYSNSKNVQGVLLSNFLCEYDNLSSPYQLTKWPFQNYKLRNWKIVLSQDAQLDAKSTKFWQTFGPLMRQLTLQNTECGNYTNRKAELIKFLRDHSPNLKNLSILRSSSIVCLNDHSGYLHVTHPSITELHMERGLFHHSFFPNLETIKLSNCKASVLQQSWYASGDLRKITRIDVMDCEVGSCVEYGRRIYSNLKHLCIDETRNNQFAEKFPIQHRGTLETLHMFYIDESKQGPARPLQAQYPMLTELRIWGNVVSDLSFLRFTPNLKILHMDLYGYGMPERMKESLSNAYSTSNIFVDEKIITEAADLLADFVLRSLEYCQINCKISHENVSRLAKWMPNLKKFVAVLQSNSFESVCNVWPQLENLDCYFGSYLRDEDLFPEMLCTVTGKRGLSNLKYLKSFHFYSQCGAASEMTEKIVLKFVEMRKLTDLLLCVSEQFSQELELIQKLGIPCVKIFRNYSSNPNHDSWDCCKKTAHKQLISKYISL